MLGRIGRAWPRLFTGMALLSLFLVLGAQLGLFHWPEDLSGPIGWLAIAITVFICVFVPVAVFAALWPGMLGMVELVLIALVLAVPVSALRLSLDLPGWTDCIVLAGLYLAAYQVLYGDWLARLGRRDTRTRSWRYEVPDPIETVWARLAPLPENAGTYYWPKAEFLAPPEGSDADFVLHAPRRRGLAPAVEAIHVEALEPGREITYRAEPLPGSHGVKERTTLRLTSVGTRTRIELDLTFLDVPLAHRFRIWLNNDANDFAASLRNRARGRRDSSVHGRQVLPV